MDQKLKKQFQEQLERDKEKITKDLESFATKDTKLKGDWDTRFPQFGTHRSEQDENINEVEKYENLLPVEHALELRLQEIDRALERMKNGNYGQCDNCAKEIEIKRLKACPEANICVKCKF